jgi:hypothetical protein
LNELHTVQTGNVCMNCEIVQIDKNLRIVQSYSASFFAVCPRPLYSIMDFGPQERRGGPGP